MTMLKEPLCSYVLMVETCSFVSGNVGLSRIVEYVSGNVGLSRIVEYVD
jgi:hypothetical protein